MRDLVTIIIPCLDQIAYTRMCIESIIKYTKHPYELIAVDNGSMDDTKRFLKSLERSLPNMKSAAVKYVPIYNRTNIGVTAALNQGIRASSGKYVCYLNNDTIVTAGWLNGLIACAQSDRKIGMVGCTTNLPKPGSDGFPDWDGFRSMKEIQRTGALMAFQRRGEYEEAYYIHGLCMFIKRTVIRRIGFFDERFYPCGFDDFDYSIRAKLAGFRLVNAKDVLIFHFWSKSTTSSEFNGRYESIEAVRTRLRRVFLDKWGNEGLAFLKTVRAIGARERRLYRRRHDIG